MGRYKSTAPPPITKMTHRERARKDGWKYTWKCQCGCHGMKTLNRNRVSRSIRMHLKAHPECSREDCEMTEVEE